TVLSRRSGSGVALRTDARTSPEPLTSSWAPATRPPTGAWSTVQRTVAPSTGPQVMPWRPTAEVIAMPGPTVTTSSTAEAGSGPALPMLNRNTGGDSGVRLSTRSASGSWGTVVVSATVVGGAVGAVVGATGRVVVVA